MYIPDFKEFKNKAKFGNLIPVYKEIVADMDTPVSAYLKIGKAAQYSFLLESVEGGERFARYSFLGSDPFLIFKSKRDRIEIIWTKDTDSYKKGQRILRESSYPLKELKRLINKFKPVKVAGLPRFSGGAVGYLSYDMVRFFERLPDISEDDLNLPDAIFVFTDTILIFDHLKHKIKVLSNAYLDKKLSDAYEEAVHKIDNLIKILRGKRIVYSPTSIFPLLSHGVNLKSNFTKKEFKEAVRKAKEYIYKGDIIQVVLSQRFEIKINVSPFDIYRALRSINPSPYLYYLDFSDLKIIGSSPEMLVRVEDGVVETCPIAGTRRRGKNEREDKKLAEELLLDGKENAEHIMLVDLGRNDLGKVSQVGSVHLTELRKIEKYSHVMHIVSSVQGRLKKRKDCFDVISSCFPAGTVSGAPKIRAMEIIEELEPNKRGLYAGCVGYFSFSGNMDTAITIRTIVVSKGYCYVQAGAGIVADSVPEREYQETVNKAKALLGAIEIAEKGL